MKKMFFIVFVLLFTLSGLTSIASAENYNGINPPPMQTIQKNVLQYGGQRVQGIGVIGLHKEREGAYLIITDASSDKWGGPYSLLRLESNDWVMNKPGAFFTRYVFILK
ncbi:conserved exported hypothetical protein [Candidatus Magnetomoraceae bacterium gMMP-15]